MALPTGPAVTFLFTDIEGSTRLERAAGSVEWARLVAWHDALLRDAIEGAGGVVVKTEGDAFFAAFDRPAVAAEAAIAAQRALAGAHWPDGAVPRVRMGLHVGEGRLRQGRAPGEPEDYVGIDVNYAARIASAGNGGQIVVSQAAVDAIGGETGLNAAGDGGVRLVDAGLRAVKDFDEPLRLHRLVVPGAADDDRPLRTLEAPSNLPADVTDLVGRDAEIERLLGDLDESRIVTLTGPGGSGKTRLALALAGAVRDRFPHGTWFVDLQAVQDPGLLEASIAAAIGLRESPNQPIAAVLHDYLRDRTVLLLLDNLEQLLPSAASTVAALARGAPNLKLLITSRELLRVAGEHGYAVPPLDVAAGTELFIARARSHRPDLQLTDDGHAAIRAISERLGGLPLAIELAAARVRLLSPALILDRLASSLDLGGGARDLPERQRTLRGAIAWSHALLSEPERLLFRRLGVFAGGWTAELAIQVADPAGDLGVDVIDGLESLADKSLVRIAAAGADGSAASDEPRFDMHQLLREFAIESLGASGERDALEARHAAALAVLAETSGAQILGPGGAAAIRRLDLEQHNIRAAIDWALATGDHSTGIRVVAPIWRWFQQRGRLREARSTLERLRARPVDDARLAIAALTAEGGLAYWSDDFPAARAAYEERLWLADETGASELRAEAHYDLGFMFMVDQDPAGLRAHEQQALDLYVAIGQQEGVARARQALALALFLTGDLDRALEEEGRNLDAFRAAGSAYQVADSMTFHAGVYFKLGDPETSWRYVCDGLRWFAENDNASGIARAIGMAAILLLTYGHAELGARVAGATYELVREKGVMLAPVKVLHLPDPADLASGRLGEERARELLEVGATTPLDRVVAEVLAAPAPVSAGATATGSG